MLRHGHTPTEHQLGLTARIGRHVGDTGAQFMLDGATYATGAELGFEGLDFYTCGRGGVLGDVPGDVVAAAFTFIGPGTVVEGWERGRTVMDPRDAAVHFMECGHRWGRTHLSADLDTDRFVELARRVTDPVVPYGLPLFAAWRTAPWPEDGPARALHAVHLLRELRGGAHVVAVLAQGIDPHAAVVGRSGATVAEFLGWTGPHPDVDATPVADALAAAEASTDLQMAHALSVLDDDELAELAALSAALRD